MSVKEFDKIFGLSSSIGEEKMKFVNRIENTIFNWYKSNYEFEQYERLFKNVCYELGLDAQELFGKNSSFSRTSVPNFKTLSKKDLFKH